jgi:hypothetical protein
MARKLRCGLGLLSTPPARYPHSPRIRRS